MAKKSKKRKCMNTVFDKLSDDDKKVLAEIWNDAKKFALDINERCNRLIKQSK